MLQRVRSLASLQDAAKRALGGPQHWLPVLLLACVMALDSADSGVVGAIAVELRNALHIGNTQIGLLTAIPSAIGAVATIPAGQLVDRMPRVPLLYFSVLLWSVATAAGGLAQSYLWLLISRIALGAVTATAGPVIASLTGDLFSAAERGRIYARILAGELLGSGLGLIAGSDIAAISWRASFWLIAALGLMLAGALRKWMPEPARTNVADEESDGNEKVGHGEEDPEQWSLWRAFRFVLSIRTNVLLIVASAIGYFFFAGMRTFAFELVRDRYGVGRAELSAMLPAIGVASLIGVMAGGRLADRRRSSGHNAARVVVPGFAYATSVLFFLPGLLTAQAAFALPLFSFAAMALAAANPPLDAARLDIMHPRLWGRAEAVRTVLRMGAQAIAPVIFGWLSDTLATGSGSGASQGTQSGIQRAFLIGLFPLLINGLLLLRARRTYPEDAATAAASPGYAPPRCA